MKSLVKAAANGKTKVKWWIDLFAKATEKLTFTRDFVQRARSSVG
jgi:hypothetical protein